jgi:hypothetical protein
MHHHERIISIHFYSCVVSESEVVSGDQVIEEVIPLIEVRFVICGTFEEADNSADQGKPRMHSTPPYAL